MDSRETIRGGFYSQGVQNGHGIAKNRTQGRDEFLFVQNICSRTTGLTSVKRCVCYFLFFFFFLLSAHRIGQLSLRTQYARRKVK